MSNSSIWSIDRTRSGATTPDQSRPGSNGNEGVVCISQKIQHYWSLTIRLFTLIYRTLVEGGSYSSVMIQLVYSTAPADWARSYRWQTTLDWEILDLPNIPSSDKVNLYNLVQTGTLAQRLECSPMARETWVQSQVESYQRL